MPTAFNAWLAFRRLVDIVLAQDLMSYAVLCFACWVSCYNHKELIFQQFPETITFPIFLSYVIGVALCVFALWAKADSYRVVKDFAWCKDILLAELNNRLGRLLFLG